MRRVGPSPDSWDLSGGSECAEEPGRFVIISLGQTSVSFGTPAWPPARGRAMGPVSGGAEKELLGFVVGHAYEHHAPEKQCSAQLQVCVTKGFRGFSSLCSGGGL